MKRLIAFAVLMATVLYSPSAAAQISALEFQPPKVPVGKVFHLVKSQLDGAHEARISYYVAAADRVEALKWDQGGDEATLVVAQLDWSRFSVRAFRVSHLARGANPEPRASLDVDADGVLTMSLNPSPVKLTHFPWQSFDFDFTGLTLVMPHLRDPESGFRFWRTDFVYADPPSVAELGEVTLTFTGKEKHLGKRTRRYSIGGPGLAGMEGTWWADAKTGLLVEFEIPVGDEPGYDSVRIRLEAVGPMSDAAWEDFKRRSIDATP
jgi:hypothetical protein